MRLLRATAAAACAAAASAAAASGTLAAWTSTASAVAATASAATPPFATSTSTVASAATSTASSGLFGSRQAPHLERAQQAMVQLLQARRHRLQPALHYLHQRLRRPVPPPSPGQPVPNGARLHLLATAAAAVAAATTAATTTAATFAVPPATAAACTAAGAQVLGDLRWTHQREASHATSLVLVLQ